MEREGGGFGLKIDARNILLIAFEMSVSSYDQLPRRIAIPGCLRPSGPLSLQLEGIFCAGFSRGAASGFRLRPPKSKQRVTLLRSQG